MPPSGAAVGSAPAFVDARPDIAAVIGTDSTGWGASWADLDLDGDLDLVLANGAIPVVEPREGRAARPGAGERRRAGQRDPLRARRGSSGSGASPGVNGRGLATADYDNDGDLDVAVNSIGGKLILLRNDGARAATGSRFASRTFAPGARRHCRRSATGGRSCREVQAGSSYLSSEDPRVHFGLGKARVVERLTVRFPDGTTTRLRNVAADRIVDVG